MAESVVINGHEMTGYAMGPLIDEARREGSEQREVVEFDHYQRKAIERLVRRNAMPANEMADGRYFQCRACGWNPTDSQVYKWFFPLPPKHRAALVKLSRKLRITHFVSARANDPNE